MFSRLNVAVAAAIALSSIGVALANSESPLINPESRSHEAPVMIEANELAVQPAVAANRISGAQSATIAPTPAVASVPAAAESVEDDELPATSLAGLVADHDDDADLSSEEKCLATAIYYEAKSESLAGQLAVGRVVVNRARSGRFPTSLCGVVTQPGQFSFVRGGRLPEVNTSGAQWRNARAIAEIAIDRSWESQAEGALFFHAAHVAPGWGRPRIARIDNHVFYR